jgi:hypothetical protein
MAGGILPRLVRNGRDLFTEHGDRHIIVGTTELLLAWRYDREGPEAIPCRRSRINSSARAILNGPARKRGVGVGDGRCGHRWEFSQPLPAPMPIHGHPQLEGLHRRLAVPDDRRASELGTGRKSRS